MIEKDGEKVVIDYNHQVYDLKDKNEIIGTFFGYNNNDKLFSGIWCHDDLNNYVIDQYGDIVSSKKDKVDLIDDSYVRQIGLKDEEYDIDQGTKNGSRMIYVGETETAEVGGKTIIYNKNTLRIVDGNSEYIGCIYLNFGGSVIFILDESNKCIKYPSEGYTYQQYDLYDTFTQTTTGDIYIYHKKDGFEVNSNIKSNLKRVIISNSVKEILRQSYNQCKKLTNIIIGNSVETIENGAFYECYSLTSITIPESVIDIGFQAFGLCENMKYVCISNKNNKNEIDIQPRSFDNSYIEKIYIIVDLENEDITLIKTKLTNISIDENKIEAITKKQLELMK